MVHQTPYVILWSITSLGLLHVAWGKYTLSHFRTHTFLFDLVLPGRAGLCRTVMGYGYGVEVVVTWRPLQDSHRTPL